MKDLIPSWSDVVINFDLPFSSDLLGLTVAQLKKKSRNGTFPAFKIGERLWRVKKDDLLSWIDKHKVKPNLQKRW